MATYKYITLFRRREIISNMVYIFGECLFSQPYATAFPCWLIRCNMETYLVLALLVNYFPHWYERSLVSMCTSLLKVNKTNRIRETIRSG